MPSGLSQSHQEIAGQFQRELLQLICLGSGGQHVQRPLPRGMGRPIGLQCPCNSFTRQEVRGASGSTNQRIENNALVSSRASPGWYEWAGGAGLCVHWVAMGLGGGPVSLLWQKTFAQLPQLSGVQLRGHERKRVKKMIINVH